MEYIKKPLFQKNIISVYRTSINPSRYLFLLLAFILGLSGIAFSQPFNNTTINSDPAWIQTARIFLVDAYQPPFAPQLEYDAVKLAHTMEEMHANVVRFGTMGKYATIQGIKFSTHPDQGSRDLLDETIEACKPKGIKVVPYISTGHKLAYSMIENDFPDYARRKYPNSPPERTQMYVGEDHANVCWMTSYREAFWEYVEHVVKDYDIAGIYFDTWDPFYFWRGRDVCYCDSCQKGFQNYSGKELPYHESEDDYTPEELELFEQYKDWYWEDYVDFVYKLKDMIKSHKDIPLIFNINNPEKIARLDKRFIALNDAVLYERGETILERAEGVSLARSLDFDVWPYVGGYNHWPRILNHGYEYQQQIFTNAMFGAGSIVPKAYAYALHPESRQYVASPFKIIQENKDCFSGLDNYPHVAVVYSLEQHDNRKLSNWWWPTNSRTESLGAFAGCLYNHIQVSSIHEQVLDYPEKLNKYRVLYLADVLHLTSKRIENIKAFVKNGGGLIVSFGASLYDNQINRQQEFALEELIKVRPLEPTRELDSLVQFYDCMLGGPNDLYLLKNNKDQLLAGEQWNKKLVPLWFYEPVEILKGATAVMDIVTGDGVRPIFPGLVYSEFGKGKVVYCASAIESLYLGDGAKVLGDLIQTMIGMVEPEKAPYSIQGPGALISNLTEDRDRWVLHLTNWTGNKFENNRTKEYYLAPVENVTLQIKIPQGKEVAKVSTLVPSKMEVKIDSENIDILLERIESYQAVIVDLK